MKHIILFLSVIFLFSVSYSQVTFQGTIVQKYKGVELGDSVEVFGPLVLGDNSFSKNYNFSETHYYAKLKSGLYRAIPKEKVILEDEEIDYWSRMWFKYRGYLKAKTGWENNKRKRLAGNAIGRRDLMPQYVDPYLQDYLEELVYKIHPQPLVRPNPTKLSIQLVNSREEKILAHNNGLIIITTGKLLQLKNEASLTRLLATHIAHIVIEHEILRPETLSYYNTNVNNFSTSQKTLANLIAQDFFKEKEKSSTPILLNQDQDNYVMKISRVILDAAWLSWHSQKYSSALEMVDRLITAHIATDETYILKAMLYRQLYHTKQSNLAALGYLEKAEKLKVHNDIAINRERGLLFLRLKRVKEAKTAFEKYLEEMLTSGDYGDDFKWTKDMIFKCDRMLLGLNEPTTSAKP